MAERQADQPAFAANANPSPDSAGAPGLTANEQLQQARQVFLAGNDLPQRWQDKDRFVILATGFGSGLNFLATWQAWRADPRRCRRLHFVCCEKQPLTAAELHTALQAWPEFAELAGLLLARWPTPTPGMQRIALEDHQLILSLCFGDLATHLRAVNASVDAFFLDGSSPAEQPSLWSPHLCRGLSRLAGPATTLAALPAGEAACQALAAAEFDLETGCDPDGKPLLLRGRFRSRRPNRHPAPTERRAIVIGAGIAGCTTAAALAAAGWQAEILERASAPATGASCNLAGVLRPLPSVDDSRLSRLTRAGYFATRALLRSLPAARWADCGVLHLGRDAEHEAIQRRTVQQLVLPPGVLQYVEREEAGRMLGLPVETGGWWFPGGGWVNPASVCRAALAAWPERIVPRFNVAVDRLERTQTGWQLLDGDGREIAAAPVVIMASGVAATAFRQFAWLPQQSARGQVSHLPAGSSAPLPHVVCRHGYAMPTIDGVQLIGATSQYDDHDPAVRLDDHRENLERLDLCLPGFASRIDPAVLQGRTGFRPMSPDRLPIVGPLPDPSAAPEHARLPALPRYPGLWCVLGFGARGIVWSALMADLLVSRLEGEPLPLENDLVDAVDPGRFLAGSSSRLVPDPHRSGQA